MQLPQSVMFTLLQQHFEHKSVSNSHIFPEILLYVNMSQDACRQNTFNYAVIKKFCFYMVMNGLKTQ